jgi:hypothetical protein
VSRLKGSVPADLDGLPLMDAGSRAFLIGPRVHRAQVTAIHDAPDGRNINDDCSAALHPQTMAGQMRERAAQRWASRSATRPRHLRGRTGRVLDGDDAPGSSRATGSGAGSSGGRRRD